MIHLTEKAIAKIIEIAEGEGLEPSVRIKVCGGGCAGMTHDIMFDSICLETDEVFNIDNIKVIVDQMSFQYLDETCIDYLEEDFGGGFKFNSDKIKSACGCGKSVSY